MHRSEKDLGSLQKTLEIRDNRLIPRTRPNSLAVSPVLPSRIQNARNPFVQLVSGTLIVSLSRGERKAGETVALHERLLSLARPRFKNRGYPLNHSRGRLCYNFAKPRAALCECFCKIRPGFLQGLGDFRSVFAAGLGHVGATAAAAFNEFGGRSDPFDGVEAFFDQVAAEPGH